MSERENNSALKNAILGTPISDGGAIFSSDMTRRYALWRRISENYDMTKEPTFVLFIGLNPSIANETIVDPTLNRCMNFAKHWGFMYVLIGNLYSTVSTDPKPVDFTERDTTNSQYLGAMHELADTTVVCWGINADREIANEAVYYLKYKPLYAFAINKNGSPKHPLYLKSSAELIPYGLR